MPVTVICPRCQHVAALPDNSVGREEKCPNCEVLLRIEASQAVCVTEQIQAQPPAPADTPAGQPLYPDESPSATRHTDRVPPEDRLDHIERMLRHMLTGVFRFAFVVLPHWISQEVGRLSPTIIKVARIVGLLVCWLAVVGLPTVLCVVYEPGTPWLLASFAWSVIALAGSAWGLGWVFKLRGGWIKARNEGLQGIFLTRRCI
jgi:hypothetical protein